jgi:oxygen-independent coproporphyrinogen III oxidase
MDTPHASTIFDPTLVARYDGPGPRYTSYPTALSFDESHGLVEYSAVARASNLIDPKPLSLYVHVPFCESPCFYCGCNKVITRDHRRADDYLVRLYAEIARQGSLFDRARLVDQLHFGGGTPTFLDDAQLAGVFATLADAFSLRTDPNREYSIEIDPRTVSTARLEFLSKLGFNRISLGIQDFDLDVQVAVNRVQSAEDTIALIHKARELRIEGLSVDLIYGLPRQTRDSFSRTLERIIDVRPDRIAAYSYAHLPHLFKPQRQIKPEHLVSAAEKLGLLGLTVERLTEAGYVYVGMDHFALPTDELVRAQQAGTLHRNFQGYSTRAECDLVAMGVSAISKVGDTYAQNAKTLPEYYRLVDSGLLAVQRGVSLSLDDRLRRDVIQRLMCATYLDFGAISAMHRIDFERYFADELERLTPFEADGLVEREGHGLRITPKGRLLMRNVAMVFDAHLGKSSPGASSLPRYSRVV